MSVFDLIVLTILAALTLRGIWKGMVSQIVSVASFFICWLVATRFGGLIAPTIPVEAPWNQVAAMATIFLVTMIAIRFAYAALEKLIRHWHLAKLNSLLGGVLGFVKGLLICLIITFFAVMFSETSRDVVFNSKTGIHLVKLITQVSVFIPKDSYEFVHTQLAQFQTKVDQAVPGRTPETLQVQSSETVQQVLGQLQPTKAKNSTSSLLSAISKWWNGSQNDAAETTAETVTVTAQQKNEQSSPSILPAVPYTPSLSPLPLVNAYTNSQSLPVVSKPAAAEEFFQKRIEPVVSSVSSSMDQLTALLPSAPEIPVPSSLSPLEMFAPLTEVPELESQFLSAIPTKLRHVGSDMLLRNSTQATNSGNSAKVFQSR